MENWRKTLSDSFRKSWGPTVTNVSWIQKKNLENFYSFNFAEDLVGNEEDEEEIDIETLDIENSNENDGS